VIRVLRRIPGVLNSAVPAIGLAAYRQSQSLVLGEGLVIPTHGLLVLSSFVVRVTDLE
jgi:hypothetical protein